MRRLIIVSVVITLFATACGDSGGGLAAGLGGGDWCDVATDIEDSSDALDDPSAAGIRQFADQIDAVKDSAPSEIRSDVKLLAEFIGDLADAVDDNDGNILLAFDDMTSQLLDPRFEEAGDRISAYNERECGILDDSSPSGSPDDGGDGTFGDVDPDDDVDDFDDFDDSGIPSEGIIAGLADSMGITEEQARCLVTQVDFLATDVPSDFSAFFEAFEDCGIDPLSLG